MIYTNRKENFEYYGLVKHLIQRLEDLHHIKIRELNAFKLLIDMISFDIIKSIKIACKLFRQVYKIMWLRLLYTIKKMDA